MNYLCLECGQKFRTKEDGRLIWLRCSNCSTAEIVEISMQEMQESQKVIDLKTKMPLRFPKKDV